MKSLRRRLGRQPQRPQAQSAHPQAEQPPAAALSAPQTMLETGARLVQKTDSTRPERIAARDMKIQQTGMNR